MLHSGLCHCSSYAKPVPASRSQGPPCGPGHLPRHACGTRHVSNASYLSRTLLSLLRKLGERVIPLRLYMGIS